MACKQGRLTATIIEWTQVAKWSTELMTCKACLCWGLGGMPPEIFEK